MTWWFSCVRQMSKKTTNNSFASLVDEGKSCCGLWTRRFCISLRNEGFIEIRQTVRIMIIVNELNKQNKNLSCMRRLFNICEFIFRPLQIRHLYIILAKIEPQVNSDPWHTAVSDTLLYRVQTGVDLYLHLIHIYNWVEVWWRKFIKQKLQCFRIFKDIFRKHYLTSCESIGGIGSLKQWPLHH